MDACEQCRRWGTTCSACFEADQALARAAQALEALEFVVETNEGTYGAEEAGRKVGTADPAFANRNVYESVSGQRRETGPDLADAPGRMRQLSRTELQARRRELAELRLVIARKGRR